MKLWIGYEKEGMHKGIYTLFIGHSTIQIAKIKNVIKKEPKIKQLYFGAGKCSCINQAVVKQCLIEFPKMLITLEVRLVTFNTIDPSLYNKVHFILTLNDHNLLLLKQINKTKVQLKLQSVEYDEKILMIQKANKFEYVNMDELQDKTYKGDIVLK